MSQESVAQYST